MPSVEPNSRPPDWDGLWWLSTTFATFGVTVRQGRVVKEESAPISYKFAGQPFQNLIAWLRKDHGFKMHKLLNLNEPVVEIPVTGVTVRGARN